MQLTARRFRIAAALVAGLAITAVGLLFWQLRMAQETARTLLIGQAEQRAMQVAHIVASRIEVVVRSADFLLLEARDKYQADQTALHQFAKRLFESPSGDAMLALQLFVSGPDGVLTYYSRGLPGRIQVNDREYFRTHLDGSDRLYVSEPIVGRVSGVSSIQLSRPILRAGRFAGVAVISISTERLGELLASFKRAPDDEIEVLNSEGVLLSLSQGAGPAERIGRKIPGPLPFGSASVPPRRVYSETHFHDGLARARAWHRIGDTGLVARVDLDLAQALAPLEQNVGQTLTNVAGLAGALLALAAGTIWLLLRMSRQQQAIAASEARFRSLTHLSSDWYWEQDERFRFTQLAGSRFARTPLPDLPLGKTRWDLPALNLGDADWARHRADLEAHRPFRDFEIRRPDTGSGPNWLSTSGEPTFDGNGRFTGYRGVGRDITERKLAEQELRDATERLHVGQATARMIVMDWDIAKDRIVWSDSPEWLRGPIPADAGRYPLYREQVHPDDRERFIANRTRSIESLQGQVQEYRIVRTDGEVLWLRSHQKVVAGPDGRAERMIVALLDITAHRAAEDHLRLSESRLGEAQRIAQIGNWELDLARDRVVWSDEVYRMFEIDRTRFGASYDAFLDAIHPDDRAAVNHAYQSSLETREPYRIVHRLRMTDGRVKYVEERCETEFGIDGIALRSRGTVQDITERMQAELALRESESRLASVIATAMDAIITIDERQGILSFNPAAEQIFGYRAEEVLGRPVGLLMPEHLRGLHLAHVEHFARSGETQRRMGQPAEVMGLRRDGTQMNMEATIARFQTEQGPTFSVMMRDVTDRKHAEEMARANEVRLQVALSNINMAVFQQDRALRYTWMYHPQLNYLPEQVVGRTDAELLPPEAARWVTELKQRVLETGARVHDEVSVAVKDATFIYDLVAEPLRDANGAITGLTGVTLDITERKKVEHALRNSALRVLHLSNRLRGVEERERRALARELHDRIGQNLSTLKLTLGMLGQQISAGNLDGVGEQLAAMQQILFQTIGHTRDVMAELRPPALEEFGLLAALRDLAADFTRKTQIAARVEGAPLEPRLPDTTEISMYRIVQEALANAAKHARATQVLVQLSSSAAAIELAIADNGVGFDADRVHRDTPTWGLATMRERAEEAGIEFAIESSPGSGARVTLRATRETR